MFHRGTRCTRQLCEAREFDAICLPDIAERCVHPAIVDHQLIAENPDRWLPVWLPVEIVERIKEQSESKRERRPLS